MNQPDTAVTRRDFRIIYGVLVQLTSFIFTAVDSQEIVFIQIAVRAPVRNSKLAGGSPAGYLFVTLLKCRPNCGCAERRNGERRLFFHENVSRRHTQEPKKVLGGSSGKDLEGKKGSLPTRRTEEKSSKFIAVVRSPLLVTRLLLDLKHHFKRSFP